MKILLEFVKEHADDETSRLMLEKHKYPGLDISLAVNCIESRRKLKNKVQEWYDNPDLLFPLKLSAEQCSSSATGKYKAELARRITGKVDWQIADMTGGLGVDSWFFHKAGAKVIYNEMQSALCDASRHNFSILGAEEITVINSTVTPGNILEAICPDKSETYPDIVYMDPARRGQGGRKVFLIEDCTPDILSLKDEIFRYSPHILVKLSPMADITMVLKRLGSCCREVHVVASGGECKELLVWMEREWNGDATIIAVELNSDGSTSTFSFTADAEKADGATCTSASILFEPGKALMKAAPFNLIASRFGICKLGKSTHYYVTDSPDKAEELKQYGKVFRIIEWLPLDKRNIKETGRRYPNSEVTARNIPMDTEVLRKKLGVTSGDDAHIFGLKSDTEGNLLIIAERI